MEVTNIIVSDERVVVIGHSSNKASCVAISAIVQTGARIAHQFDLLSKSPTVHEGEQPLYDIRLEPSESSSKLIDGLLDSFHALEQTVPGSLKIHHARKKSAA